MQKAPYYHFNRFVCIFWTSRFFYWIFLVIASQFLFFFAVYRFLDVTGADDYKMISEEYQILAYSTTITVFSVFITLPQTFSENIVGDECNCFNRKIRMPLLSIVYAQVYIWIAILIVFDGCVLAYVSVRLRRLLKTPAECRREDKLELLHFYNITLSESHASANTIWRGMKTSLCVIPLFVSYLVLLSYDQFYQLASAVDLTTYVIGAPAQRFGELLIVANCVNVPIIIVVYIHPLRMGVKKCWKTLVGKI
ncbi:unnamed protein product [Dibothriocephalus latus]|uniref:G-protein coupled receptors family 1 profile domain-containing protein n=1 Tax=Dibothriocephalus latus TaxID=60516 RepID=A0A3P6TK81_DIBLA|nr:unnamed protein product [Dibothriocephalus latus]